MDQIRVLMEVGTRPCEGKIRELQPVPLLAGKPGRAFAGSRSRNMPSIPLDRPHVPRDLVVAEGDGAGVGDVVGFGEGFEL